MAERKKRGRAVGSTIRDNLVEILFFLKEAHGYDLYKFYKKIVGKPISIRTVYYHLAKGQDLGVFELKGIQTLKGDYSWGSSVERKIFRLGKQAQPRVDNKIKNAIEEIKAER
jgi:hypothetical protein